MGQNLFQLGPDIIKENCKFAYYFNQTDITPTVLHGGNKINLANWPDDKHIFCNVNNEIDIDKDIKKEIALSQLYLDWCFTTKSSSW